MVEAGVLAEGENVELIDGELVMMAAKGYAHELIRQTLLTRLIIDANEHIIWVHKGPTESGWQSVVEHGPGDALSPTALSGIVVRLAELR